MAYNSLSPRKRVELALKGENPGRVPFIIWNNKLPDDRFAKTMLDAGACIVVKSSVYNVRLNSIVREEKSWVDENGQKMRQTIYHTQYGDIDETNMAFTGSQLPVNHLFKGPENYDAIISLINDTDYLPCFDKFIRDDKLYGEQGIARPATEKSPFFQIIYDIMGVMNFAIEWQENRDKILELYEALHAARRKRLEIVAASPTQYCIVDGNIEMSIVGRERFENYYLPLIREACDILNPKGILTGLHLDGNNKMLIDYVADLPVRVIESFTPPPDCDTTLEEGLKAWPGKAFMINFPSSLHFEEPKVIEENAISIMNHAKNSGRVMLGVLEDVPKNDYLPWMANLVADRG
jgi:hypothetical protein